MKQIPLTQNQVAFVDDEDYIFLSQWKWCVLKGNKTNYAVRGRRVTDLISTSMISMHR